MLRVSFTVDRLRTSLNSENELEHGHGLELGLGPRRDLELKHGFELGHELEHGHWLEGANVSDNVLG